MFRDVAEITELAQKLNLLESKLEYYERELEHLRSSRYTFDHIIGTSQVLEDAKRLASKAAEGASTVLLLGESGVGKELFAHAIHRASPRRSKAFVRVNCSSIPHDLLESGSFGYEAGAFTGAGRKGKPGKFELANQGTIFLDEIGDMPLTMQAKLLRVLQEREVERLGGTRTFGVDFRLIAATNANPEHLVQGRAAPSGPLLPTQRGGHPYPTAPRSARGHSGDRPPSPGNGPRGTGGAPAGDLAGRSGTLPAL